MIQKLSHTKLIARQKTKMNAERLPFVVVLNNIRSLYNVGSIFRTGDGAGVDKIWICGITGHPPNNQISKTALGAEDQVDWEYRKDIHALLKELRAKNYQIVLLEQTQESVSFDTFMPNSPVCLVIGNEIEGVSQNILPLCDKAIDIEMAGIKNSLNVSVAFGVIAYHFRKCFKNIPAFR